MNNNFDLKDYMKENKVGSYQQLNEMWYQDINQALGDFNTIKEVETEKEKAMYANTDPNITDPINEDDDIFAGSDTANWDYGKGNDTSEWDTNIAGQTVNGWTASESQGGAIAWENPKYPYTLIYATPGWEGVDGIALEVYSEIEDGLDEPMLRKVVGTGTEAWKTEDGYMALMGKVFTTLEKKLKPSVDVMDMKEKKDPKPEMPMYEGGDEDMDMSDDDRMMSLGGDQIKAGIERLLGDGFDYREILQFVKDTIGAKRNF